MKQMRQKGFTLVELLVTITVLALITSIAYPVITGIMQETKENAYKIQIQNIVKASNDWIKQYPSALPDTEGDKITIQLLHLKNAGLVDKDLKNPITKKLFPDDMEITILYTKDKYVPTVDDKSGTSTTSSSSTYKSMIVLKGGSHITEEINSKESFVDPGVVGYNENGQTISSSSIVTTVRKMGTVVDKVDMTKLGLYKLTYEVSIDGKKAEAKRTVEIVDTTPPVITTPKNTTISTASSSFDVMEGVSASDNSGERVTVTAKGNVTLHVPGVYVVRYTAEDSSGNKREKKRTITVVGDICTKLLIKSSVKSGTLTNQNVTLTATALNGNAPDMAYNYQWQKLVNNVWTNIAGATNLSYTETSDSTTKYRLVYNGADCGAQSDEYTMNIDKTPPACPTITSTVAASKWSNATLKITVTPTSDHASYSYAISTNGGAYGSNTSKTATASFTISGDGKKRVRVIAKDKAGNSKTCTSSEYWMDHTAPSSLKATKSPSSGCATSPTDFIVTLSATESGSGIKNWSYSTNNSTFTAWSSSNKSPFTTNWGHSVQNRTIYFRVYDNAGNYASTSATVCVVNPSPPSHTHAVGYLGTTNHAVSGATLSCGEYHTTAAYGYCKVCWDYGVKVRADTYWYCQNSPLYPRVVPD